MTHVFVSPHPDDAALSCGGLITSLRELGQSVTILTVYSGTADDAGLPEYQRVALGFGNKTGFRSLEETPHLVNVSCETCHGPCSEHVESAGKAPTPLKVDCMTCHNLEHSTSFDQKEYWKQITCTSDQAYGIGKKDGKTGEQEHPGEGDRQATETDRKGH